MTHPQKEKRIETESRKKPDVGISRQGILKAANKTMGFPGGSEVKASAYNAGDLGLIPGSGRSPGEGNGNPLQYSCPGRRSLVGYSSRGRKESDMTERLDFHFL